MTTGEMALETAVKASLFRGFFTLLEQKEIPYAILSNYFEYPENIHSDIDFVVPEQYRASIPSLVQTVCFENDAHLLQISEYHNTSAFSCFVATLRDNVPIHLRLDVCSDDHSRDKLILPWEFMLEGRRRYRDSFYVPAPEKSLLHYLLKRAEKRNLEDRQMGALYRWYQAAPNAAEELLRAYWPGDHEQILTCIGTQTVPRPEWLAAWWRNVHLRDAHQSAPARARQYLRELRRKVRRVRHPLGYMISFLGPDGCGKSTAIAGVKRALHPAFARTAEFHLLPRSIHKGRKDHDASQPHAKTARGPLLSMAKTALWLADLSVGYWTRLRPKMVRSTLIIFDRYIHDLQVDRTRYRDGGPRFWARWTASIAPQPDLWILLDAPPEVLWQRKPELPIEESARQRAAYRRLMSGRANAEIIDANRPASVVIAGICAQVFLRLEARTARWYRLPQREPRSSSTS